MLARDTDLAAWCIEPDERESVGDGERVLGGADVFGRRWMTVPLEVMAWVWFASSARVVKIDDPRGRVGTGVGPGEKRGEEG